MKKPRMQDCTVTITAFRMSDHYVVDWHVYRPTGGSPLRRPRAHRRVRIALSQDLDAVQLTEVCRRMALHVLSTSRGNAAVPRGLPWHEVGAGSWSVPPGGGEGGANRSEEET
jgi:hypothetical protein